jgi:ATP/maltotriose-dependent transcriptional regulator MalT
MWEAFPYAVSHRQPPDMPRVIEGAIPAGRASSPSGATGRGVVHRSALFDRLSGAEPGGVMLLCAPAGSGKTVLLRSWIDATGLEDRV